MEIRILLLLFISILEIQPLIAQNHQKKGIGVVFLKKSVVEDKALNSKMELYETNNFSDLFGYFKLDPSDRFNVSVENGNHEHNSFFEFDYETFGLPITEVGNDFIKIIYGYSEDYDPLFGYIRKDSTNYGFLVWEKFLLEKPIFFKNSDPVFYNRINGKKIQVILPNRVDVPDRKDYIMYPKEIKNNWMKVDLVTPSNYCDEPDELYQRELWIEYLDYNCELRVWYYTRGC